MGWFWFTVFQRKDPDQFMQLHGRKCIIHTDKNIAKAAEDVNILWVFVPLLCIRQQQKQIVATLGTKMLTTPALSAVSNRAYRVMGVDRAHCWRFRRAIYLKRTVRWGAVHLDKRVDRFWAHFVFIKLLFRDCFIKCFCEFFPRLKMEHLASWGCAKYNDLS